jgi:hypothetical protein
MKQYIKIILPEFLMSLSNDLPQLRISSNVGLQRRKKNHNTLSSAAHATGMIISPGLMLFHNKLLLHEFLSYTVTIFQLILEHESDTII